MNVFYAQYSFSCDLPQSGFLENNIGNIIGNNIIYFTRFLEFQSLWQNFDEFFKNIDLLPSKGWTCFETGILKKAPKQNLEVLEISSSTLHSFL